MIASHDLPDIAAGDLVGLLVGALVLAGFCLLLLAIDVALERSQRFRRLLAGPARLINVDLSDHEEEDQWMS